MHITDEHLEHLKREYMSEVLYCTADRPLYPSRRQNSALVIHEFDATHGIRMCPHCGYQPKDEEEDARA